LGFPGNAIVRANLFLEEPDQQLNRWTDGNTVPHYGQGYLLNRYLYTQLGPDLYREFATSPEPGFAALDALATAHNLPFTGQSLWLDWLAALAIHEQPGAAPKYDLGTAVDTVTMTSWPTSTTSRDLIVSQYAADYYELEADEPLQITFTGSNHVQLLNVLPHSGERMWLSNRANFSQASLTRTFDLTAVTEATLHYAVYHEIEAGYDFAYVSVSTDEGRSWQELTAPAMQGAEAADDPSDSALTEHFYTDNSNDWQMETADLTPYAGQMIQLRFEYVTDPILTVGGLAVDDISIPEIGFYDDAEGEAEWQSVGFVRATGYVPQQWHVQLITFGQGEPVVQTLPLNEDNTLSVDVPTSDRGERPILIIAATAPLTLLPAHYQLTVE
jgi:hypothetical protein